MGGKARLRKWLVNHFPESGMFYCEPFAGKGNVFFHAVQQLKFTYWELSDLDLTFLDALRCADLSQLPDAVTKVTFPYWRERDDFISRLIEPRITFAGKGYAHGFSGSSGTHVGYSGPLYRQVCEAARGLLESRPVKFWLRDWRETLEMADQSCFVYLDPPYLDTSASYANIDHTELISRLNEASFDWAISGYRSDLYDGHLRFKCRFERERNSEIKSSNVGAIQPVTECLWTSYEL